MILSTIRDELGTSVVEVMVATIVFMVVMIGGLHYYMLPQATLARKKINRIAISETQKRMETLIALGYAGLSTDSNEVNTALSVGARSGLRTTTITEVDDPLDGIGGADTSGDSVDYKQISVDVSWNDGNEQSVSFSTVVSNISSSGSSGSGSSGGSFTGSAWGRKCELVIQSDKVNEVLTDFPILLTEDTLPVEMFDSDGLYPALDSGGDIRFSSDAAGENRLACELVTFTTHNKPSKAEAEIWVNVPSVFSSSNTSIWVWYNKSDENQPDRDEVYGSEAVWTGNYVMVQHLNQNPTDFAPQFKDATSYNRDGTNNRGLKRSDLKNGVIGKGIEFDGKPNDDIDLGIWDVTGSALTVQHWVYVDEEPDTDGRFFSRAIGTSVRQHWIMTGIDAGDVKPRFRLKTNGSTKSIEEDGFSEETWHFMAATYDGSKMRIWVDDENIEIEDKSGSISTSGTVHNYLGDNPSGGRQLEGRLDEVRVSDVRRSDNWLLAEYNNQLSPGTFVIAETPQFP